MERIRYRRLAHAALIGLLCGCASVPGVPDPSGDRPHRAHHAPGAFAKARAMGRHLLMSFTLGPVKQPLTAARDLALLTTTSAFDYTSDFAHDALAVLQRDRAVPPVNPGAGMDIASWERRLDRITGTRLLPGTLELLVDGDEYFPRMLKAVHEARTSIEVRTYVFDNDDFAVGVADRLAERSADVAVRVMMDGIGSWTGSFAEPPGLPLAYEAAPPDMARYLKRGGTEVRVLPNTWFAGDHTKAVIVDRRIAFVGGMNIGREYRFDWHDIMVQVTGEAAARLSADFETAWRHHTFGDLAYLTPPVARATGRNEGGEQRFRLLYTKPGNAQIYRAHLEAIRRAERHIYVETPYFSDDRIRRALIAARRRGVDVRVIVPSQSDSAPMDRSNVSTVNELLKNGVRVFEFPGMSHVKAAMFDGWACFGSANLDRLSLRVNKELDIATSDPAIVAELDARLFQRDFERSIELTAPRPSRWNDPLYEMLADIML